MNIRRRLARVFATTALTVLTVPAVGVLAPQRVAGGAEDGPFRVLGTIAHPKGAPKSPTRASSIVAVDAERRRLYVQYTDSEQVAHVVTYDMRPTIPRQIANGVLGPEGDYNMSTRYTVALDTRRQNLAFISTAFEYDGHSVPTGTATLAVYHDPSGKVVKKWNLTQVLPGFYPLGITYSAVDDRYYAVGEFSGQKNVADGTGVAGGKPYGPGTGVVALNADDGSVKWVRQVPECQQALYSKDIGSLIVRSTRRPAVLFSCVSGGSPSGQTYPGQAGLVRLAVDPNADHAAAARQSLEFYAISGNYFAGGQKSGIAGYDGSTDRFYLQSIAYTTPGAFVFDGQLSAWVGFVSAPTNSNLYIGINEGLGHLYMGLRKGGGRSPDDGVLVADVRQTPVPAGEFTSSIATSSLIATDSKTRRLFLRPFDVNEPFLVVEDTTPETHGTADPDYDAGTSNLPDTPDNDVFYSIGATGYGAQAVQVGGAGAPLTAGGPNGPKLPVLAPGTRALMSARVGAVDLRDGGASAGAQAALVDLNSAKEYEGNAGQPWPYPVGACLDAGGRPVKASWTDSDRPTAAMYDIECDLARKVVKATVRMGAVGVGGMHVKKSAFGVLAGRNTTDGAIVTTHSYASGVSFEPVGGYVVRLGNVQASTSSQAHGTPGTTYAKWTREVDGIRVLDPEGKTVFAQAGCASLVEVRGGQAPTRSDTCGDVAAVLNKLLPTRFRIEFPVPEVTATPKGAFAGVEQTQAQYYQQLVVNDQGVVYRGDSVGIRPAPAVVTEVYNDTTERSRTVTVLAATQANAVFQVNKRLEGGGPSITPGGTPGGQPPGGPGGNTGGNTGGTGDPGGTLPPDRPEGDQPVDPQSRPNALPASDVTGFLFMRRGARDIALLVLLAGLVAGGFGTAWRRRRLVQVLVTVPRKEAL